MQLCLSWNFLSRRANIIFSLKHKSKNPQEREVYSLPFYQALLFVYDLKRQKLLGSCYPAFLWLNMTPLCFVVSGWRINWLDSMVSL